MMFVSTALALSPYADYVNTGELSSEYGGYIYTDPDGNTWGAVATTGTGDNKPADGGAGREAGSEGEVEKTKATKEEHSAIVSEDRPVPGSSGSSTVASAPRTSVVEHRVEGSAEITRYSDGSERVVITSGDSTVYTKDTYSDGTFTVKADRTYTPGALMFADSSGSGSSKTDSSSASGEKAGKGDGTEGRTTGGTAVATTAGTPGGTTGKTGDTGAVGKDAGTSFLGSGLEGAIGAAAATGTTGKSPSADTLKAGVGSFFTGAGSTDASSDTGDLRSAVITGSDYVPGGDITMKVVKTDSEGRTYEKTITDAVDRWKDVPATIKLDDGREVARPQSTTDYLRATVYEPEEKTVTSTGAGSVDYTYYTQDGEAHTIHYSKGDGTVSYTSIVTDADGREVALVHTFRRLEGDREEVTSLGYEWSVQNFTDESSPYYGRYVSRTQPIPSATRGGRDKGGLLPVGTGVFSEVFINYGEHTMMVQHYFNVDVYSEYESCDDGDCETIEVYEYSYITKNPPEYYDFHVPLVCLDCVPPAPGVRVCIGGGCDCIGTEDLVCDTDHSTERYMDIETHVELER